MTSEQSGEAPGKMLGDMVKDADEYYAQLQKEHASETRVFAAVMGVLVWFASFVALGVTAFVAAPRGVQVEYLLFAFAGAVAVGTATGIIMFLRRRSRGMGFDELGALLSKFKEHGASAEDGLRLMDVMHRAALAARKKRLDTALEYGVAAFILVSFVSFNAGFGALAGVVVFLYFRFEALRDYEKEEQRYEIAKKDILLNL